ncbi:MAG TPA: ABC transporter permease [Verrucomicrobiae bacterium]|nr:ABC transporter permease [Verrucomicrobiae bacterium]
MKFVRQLLPFASLLFVLILLSVLRPDTFLSTDNFLNVFRRSTVNIILAVGMTAIIISGGIDLSIGSMLALCGMVGAWTMKHFGGDNLTPGVMWLGTFAGIIAGIFAGFTNGALINGLKLPPFILTLGTMSAFRGISYVMNDGQPYNVPAYQFLGNGQIFGLSVSVVIAVVIVLIAVVVLNRTTLGRYTYAIGANRTATLYSGVNVTRNLTLIYTLSGMLVGVAAMIETSRTVSAQPTAGIGLELDIIAAVVIGGASLNGGRGTILGTIIGTLLISFLRNGCTLLGISTNVQLIVIGAIIVLAVSVDQIARGKSKS